MVNIASFLFPLFDENTYLVFDETKECIIIDPGCYTDTEQSQLFDYIDYLNLKPKLLINTHCHIDHVIGNRFIKEKYNIPLALHEMDIKYLKAMPSFSKKNYNLEVDGLPENYQLLNEEDIIAVGNSSFEVMHTPGHTPGSISFYCEKENLLISGDVLFKNRIGRIDLPGGNYDELKKCIKEKIFLLDDEVTVYPGHGPSTTIGYEKANNTFVAHWI